MTTSRLFPATNGPASATAYSGPFLFGIAFKTIGPKIQWLTGYWVWCCGTGQSTTAVYKCALWVMTSASATQQVPNSAAQVTGVTAGQWNFIPLATPIPICIGPAYVAACGYATNTGAGTGFADTQQEFGSVAPATYQAGITSGSLYAYSDGTNGGTGIQNPTLAGVQGLFSVAGTDPTVNCPNTGSNSSNFWIDLQVSDTAPLGYTGTYQFYPNNVIGNIDVAADLNIAYNVGTEFALSQACLVHAISYLSPPTATQLATRASIWTIDATGLVRAEVAGAVISAPSWSGAAASGWVTANFATPPRLPPGKYVVAVYNSAANGVGAGWNAKDSITGAFGPGGDFTAGISNGPLSAPGLAAASVCYDYNGSAPGATPPYSAGTTEPGQNCFGQEPDSSLGAPFLYAGPSQNYFVDVIVSVAPPLAGGFVPDDRSHLKRLLIW